MRFGRRPKGFTPPEQYPELTELQVGILKMISREETVNAMRYSRLLQKHIHSLPEGVPIGSEGRRIALAIAHDIARLQHFIAGTGPLFLPGLPPELNPAQALANHQRTAYACTAMAAPDTLPETILSVRERNSLATTSGLEWYVTVNGFTGRISDQRLGELLDEAALAR